MSSFLLLCRKTELWKSCLFFFFNLWNFLCCIWSLWIISLVKWLAIISQWPVLIKYFELFDIFGRLLQDQHSKLNLFDLELTSGFSMWAAGEPQRMYLSSCRDIKWLGLLSKLYGKYCQMISDARFSFSYINGHVIDMNGPKMYKTLRNLISSWP